MDVILFVRMLLREGTDMKENGMKWRMILNRGNEGKSDMREGGGERVREWNVIIMEKGWMNQWEFCSSCHYLIN